MFQKGFVSIILLLLIGCGSSGQVEKDNRLGFGTAAPQQEVVPDYYWVSLASSGDKAVKNSEALLGDLVALTLKPKNNIVTGRQISGRYEGAVSVKKSGEKVDTGVVSGPNFYKVFLKGDGGTIKNGTPFTLNFEFKAIDNVEKNQVTFLKEQVQTYFKKYLLKKYGKKDFDVKAHFLITKIDKVEFKRNTLSYRVHLLLSSLKAKKIDYSMNPDAFAKKIETAIQGGDFPKAKKLNEKFKTIAVDKKVYYRYAMLISEFTEDSSYGIVAAVDMIGEYPEKKVVKNGIQMFQNTYQQKLKLSKKKKRRVMKKIRGLIWRYNKKKLNNIELSKKFKEILKKYPIK